MTILVRPETDALVIADVQIDFCPGGALGIANGDLIIPVVNRLLHLTGWLTIASRDWHPANHCSFTAQGGPWPVHCVVGTAGAGFHPALDVAAVRHIVSKATAESAEAYSAFQGTDLHALLRRQNIRRVFVCGLATDYCVKATALDARRNGYETVVVTDAIQGVELRPGDCAAALRAMQAAGVTLATSSDLSPAG